MLTTLLCAMGPHENQPVLRSGAPLHTADGAMIMLHGRGATPDDILGLAEVFEKTRFAYIAPAAAGNAWYPYTFMAPREKNEPWLSSALAMIEALVTGLLSDGFRSKEIVLLGFS